MELFEPCNEEVVTPAINIVFGEEQLVLHYFNSRIRLFPETKSLFNHIEFWDNAGDLQATQNQELMDTMFELGYPVLSMPYVDQETEDWLADCETTDLDAELGQL